jgi:protein tyrosine/serine phosphatase
MLGLGREVMRASRTWLAICLVCIPAFPGIYWLDLQVEGNFHAVVDRQIYRSRQLSPGQLATLVQRYKIRSVLNLRGANKGDRWYQDEIRTSDRLDVRHYDYGLSSGRDVSPSDLDWILEIIRNAPKPILIHCKFGADRTALVAAAYLYAVAGKDAAEAARQLSVRYGHFPYLWSRTGAMDRSFWRYVERYPRN